MSAPEYSVGSSQADHYDGDPNKLFLVNESKSEDNMSHGLSSASKCLDNAETSKESGKAVINGLNLPLILYIPKDKSHNSQDDKNIKEIQAKNNISLNGAQTLDLIKDQQISKKPTGVQSRSIGVGTHCETFEDKPTCSKNSSKIVDDDTVIRRKSLVPMSSMEEENLRERLHLAHLRLCSEIVNRDQKYTREGFRRLFQSKQNLNSLLEDVPPNRRMQMWYMHDDAAPPYFKRIVRQYLTTVFGTRWIGRGGPVLWTPMCPELNPKDLLV